MSDHETDQFDSFEEFEREFLPERHAARRSDNPWSTERLATDIARDSLSGVREAVERAAPKAK